MHAYPIRQVLFLYTEEEYFEARMGKIGNWEAQSYSWHCGAEISNSTIQKSLPLSTFPSAAEFPGCSISHPATARPLARGRALVPVSAIHG